MGCGIAAFFAKAGCAVTVYDAVPQARIAAKGRVAGILVSLARNGSLGATEVPLALDRMCVVDELAVCSECGLVIESIPESLEWKRALFAELDRSSAPDTVLATNTSSFSPAAISEGLSHPGRVLATHFYYPAELLPLVEMVAGPSTASWAMAATSQFLTALGKSVVLCKDTAGYLGSRVQMALILEAIRILEEGTATAADIDNAVRASVGPRLAVMGPLETVDRAGLDIYLKASQGYLAAFGRDTFRPPQLLADKVAAGELGYKTGRGLQGDTGALDRPDGYDQLAGVIRHIAGLSSERRPTDE
jgi:3-hydroxybutyryl-CoA dehydrogenase